MSWPNAERLVTAASSWVQSHQAESHLASVGEHESRRPEVATTFRATYDGRGLAVSGYQLPETPTRDAREIAFAVAAGRTLVITGPSGSGKTTLITAIATALRQRPGPAVVTAVQADDYLFTGTVAKNLRLANPTANDAAVADLLTAMALDRAGVGPQTNLGVGGRSLSGGEQRRLHIARPLATQPDVLLIDEPTTGLDTDTPPRSCTRCGAGCRGLSSSWPCTSRHQTPGPSRLTGPRCQSDERDPGALPEHTAAWFARTEYSRHFLHAIVSNMRGSPNLTRRLGLIVLRLMGTSEVRGRAPVL